MNIRKNKFIIIFFVMLVVVSLSGLSSAFNISNFQIKRDIEDSYSKNFDITFPWGRTKVYLNIKRS